MRRLLLCLVMMLPIHGFATTPLDGFETLSLMHDELSGRFEQTKYIQVIDAGFESSGEFSYIRGESIEWKTLSPIESVLLLTPRSIVNRQGETELSNLDGETNPVVRVFSDIFFGVMTADWARLSEYFDMSLRGEANQWSVYLTPIDEGIERVVSRVELSGDTHLREVRLFELSGDHTHIRFIDLAP